MTQDDIDELHYICPINNLPSILAKGVLSHGQAAKLPHQSVAMTEIQDRRRDVIVPGARPLHEYVNLYFNARNKMMYKVVHTHDVASICVLRIEPAVLDLPGVIVADQNASSGHARFEPTSKGLARISKDLVFARYWNHPDDPIESMRHGSIVCAEILVPDRLHRKHITGVYVASQQAASAVAAVAPGMQATINGDLFFQ